MNKVSGIVVKEYAQNRGSFRYQIRDKNGDKDFYVTFDDYRILMHYNITATYTVIKNKNPKYSDSKNIINVKYHNLISDINAIKNYLLYEKYLSKKTFRLLFKNYKSNILVKIINDFDSLLKLDIIEKDKIILKK